MTKTKFLKELDKSLYVLAEVERNDIINEYRDIIEEKVKHGKTEKEAVEEFGSIEELSREILSAYKVNPDYGKKEKDDDFSESAKKLGSEFDSFVKKGAKKATEFTKEIVEEIKQNDNEITIEFVFELLFKGLATLIIMFIVSLPFMLVREIGTSMLGVVVFPLDRILIVVWTLLISILFVGTCALIFIAMFKQYFKGKNNVKKNSNITVNENVKSTPKKDSKNNEIKSEKIEESKIVEPVKKREPRAKKKGTPLLDIFLAIAKAVLVIMMLPLIFFNIGTGFGIAITIYLMIKGLVIPGFLLVLIAVLTFFGHLQSIFFNVIFKQKKIYFYPFIIAIVIGIIGGIMCFDQAVSMNYYDKAPDTGLVMTTDIKLIDARTKEINFEYYSYDTEVEYKIDSKLKDNQIKIETNHYKELSNIQLVDYDVEETVGVKKHIIRLHNNSRSFFSQERKTLNKEFIENFNDKKIYNYDELYNAKVIVTTNGKIKVNDIRY